MKLVCYKLQPCGIVWPPLPSVIQGGQMGLGGGGSPTAPRGSSCFAATEHPVSPTWAMLDSNVTAISWLLFNLWLFPGSLDSPAGVKSVQFSSFQSLSRVQLFATPWTVARQTSQSITNSRSLLKLMFIVSWGMPPNHLILCHPLLLLPSIFPSISVFSSESALHIRWPKYWSFSFNISPSNEYSGLISFRMDWLDLLAVQETQESSPTPQFKRSQILILYLPTLSSLSGLFQSTFCPLSVHP